MPVCYYISFASIKKHPVAMTEIFDHLLIPRWLHRWHSIFSFPWATKDVERVPKAMKPWLGETSASRQTLGKVDLVLVKPPRRPVFLGKHDSRDDSSFFRLWTYFGTFQNTNTKYFGNFISDWALIGITFEDRNGRDLRFFRPEGSVPWIRKKLQRLEDRWQTYPLFNILEY